MKELIPLKKDILFKTTIGKITNINLDHDYKVKDNLIEGNIILDGSYKMTEASVLEEEFSYKIPFGVSISKNIKKDSIKIEIDDFKYTVKNDILSVSIDLLFTCENEEIKEEVVEEVHEEVDNSNQIDNTESINTITNNIITNDNKYYTYKIYIVRENDTIEEICSKYNVTLNDINEYNDINKLNVGDKIIIPYINE